MTRRETLSRTTTSPAPIFPRAGFARRSCRSRGRVGAGRRPSNQRLKLAACGRRLRRKAQWRFFFLIAAPSGRSLSAIR
jgi:hypothetical protein